MNSKEILRSDRATILNYSMKDPLLGLDAEMYYKLSREVTTVIHNAWRVDFNQTIQGFENDCLRGKLDL